jgi:hypothetical protein
MPFAFLRSCLPPCSDGVSDWVASNIPISHLCTRLTLGCGNKGGKAFKMLLQDFTVFIATLPPMIYSSLPRQPGDVISVHGKSPVAVRHKFRMFRGKNCPSFTLSSILFAVDLS